MFAILRPTDDEVRHYLARQADEPFSYDRVGCTREIPDPRPGWNIDRHRALLGHGPDVFAAASEAIRTWQMFPRQMATLFGHATPQVGQVVGVLYRARIACCWMLMPARVVYVLDETVEREDATVHRYGFAYGTLADHPERGEERFLVEWNERTGEVWYDLLPVSQPAHWLARVGYFYTRFEQARFRRLSGRAMQQAVLRQPVQA